jgi:hypothetical protein
VTAAAEEPPALITANTAAELDRTAHLLAAGDERLERSIRQALSRAYYLGVRGGYAFRELLTPCPCGCSDVWRQG